MTSGEGVDAWVEAHGVAATSDLRGGRLLSRAATAFIMPLAGALVGAMLAGAGETQRFVGMVAGLLVSTGLGIGIARLMRGRPDPNCPVGAADGLTERAEELS